MERGFQCSLAELLLASSDALGRGTSFWQPVGIQIGQLKINLDYHLYAIA